MELINLLKPEGNETLINQITVLQENIAILAQQRYGRRTEKLSEIPGQLHLSFDTSDAFNEAANTIIEKITCSVEYCEQKAN